MLLVVLASQGLSASRSGILEPNAVRGGSDKVARLSIVVKRYALGARGGRSRRNVVPTPGLVSKLSFAPITSAAREAMVNPNPTPAWPCVSPREKALKMRS